MLVGEVRWATLGVAVLLEVVGREPVVLGAGQGLEVAPGLARHLDQELAVLRRELPPARHGRPAEPVGAGGRRRPQGEERQRERQRAGPRGGGEREQPQRPRSGSRPSRRRRSAIPARSRPAARAACAAAVSHSRRRRCVMTSRTSVRAMACTISQAWNGRKTSVRSACAKAVLRSSTRPRRWTRAGSCAARRSRSWNEGGDERERDDREAAEGPDERAARQQRPRGREEGEERGRHEAAPEVVEDLPLADERQAVLREALRRRDQREEPGEDLPVAAHPAVLPPRVREDVGGVVVHHLDVGDERGARVQPLEEIVREQRVLGDAPADGRLEGVDVVQPLAGEDPLAEQVLVGVRDRRRVGVDAGVPGVHPREERPGGAREVDAHARLEDAVALGDPAAGRRRPPAG